jgi:Protein of unknown function (DUF3160)
MKKKNLTISLIVFIIFVIIYTMNGKTQEGINPDIIEEVIFDQGPSSNWEENIESLGLTENELSSLKENGIIVTNNTYTQNFSCYIRRGGKLFITSDAVLNAYHVLYEESFLHLESQKAPELPGILKSILNHLDACDSKFKGNPDLITRAKQRNLLVLGIAMKLMDETFRFNDPELDQIIQTEVEKIMAGKAIERPSFLSNPDSSFSTLDYSRFTPREFYTRTPLLSRYFQAVSWLQSIPYRVHHNEELVAILMLGASVNESKGGWIFRKNDHFEEYFQSYKELIGSHDDLDIITASSISFNTINLAGNGLDDIRKTIKEIEKGTIGDSLINDQIRFPESDPKLVDQTDFRVISAHRVPSAVLFQQTTDIRQLNRLFPNGLEIPAALGSSFARELIDDKEKDAVIAAIDSCQESFKGEGLYTHYLDTLRTLANEPDKGAPDFTRKDSWKRKSCNTVLASWAQMRHTYALHAKESAIMAGECEELKPAGFVEPNPKFFHQMGTLIQNSRKLLKAQGAFNQKINYQDGATNNIRSFNLDVQWERLESLCADLEGIATKQVNHDDLTVKDNNIITGFGFALAEIMFHYEDAYGLPKDEAPKIVDVYSNVQYGGYLHVGVSRARTIYVLYPWKGKTYFCEGAIMPYYEFVSPTRLTDESWMTMLDSDDRPPIPNWMSPIVKGGHLSKREDSR